MNALIRHHGRVVVSYRVSLRFAVEEIQKFGLSVVRFRLETGEYLWYIIGCYLAPNKASTITSIISMLRDHP